MRNIYRTQTQTVTWSASGQPQVDLDNSGLITELVLTAEVTPSATLTGANQPAGLLRVGRNFRVEGGETTFFLYSEAHMEKFPEISAEIAQVTRRCVEMAKAVHPDLSDLEGSDLASKLRKAWLDREVFKANATVSAETGIDCSEPTVPQLYGDIMRLGERLGKRRGKDEDQSTGSGPTSEAEPQ